MILHTYCTLKLYPLSILVNRGQFSNKQHRFFNNIKSIFKSCHLFPKHQKVNQVMDGKPKKSKTIGQEGKCHCRNILGIFVEMYVE